MSRGEWDWEFIQPGSVPRIFIGGHSFFAESVYIETGGNSTVHNEQR